MKIKLEKKNNNLNIKGIDALSVNDRVLSGLPLGTIISSAVAQDDPCLRLLDGSVISMDGMYAQFATWLKEKKAADSSSVPTCSAQEYANDLSTYLQCGRFIINDTDVEMVSGSVVVPAHSIKLPRITEFIASSNGGQAIGIAELDSFKSHTHTVNTQNINGWFTIKGAPDGNSYLDNHSDADNVVFKKGSSKGSQKILNGTDKSYNVSINGFTFNGSHAHTAQNAGGSETKPKNIRYPYYIVVASGAKSGAVVDAEKYASDVNALSAEIAQLKNKMGMEFVGTYELGASTTHQVQLTTQNDFKDYIWKIYISCNGAPSSNPNGDYKIDLLDGSTYASNWHFIKTSVSSTNPNTGAVATSDLYAQNSNQVCYVRDTTAFNIELTLDMNIAKTYTWVTAIWGRVAIGTFGISRLEGYIGDKNPKYFCFGGNGVNNTKYTIYKIRRQ